MKIREIINVQHEVVEVIKENTIEIIKERFLKWFGKLKMIIRPTRIAKIILERNSEERLRKRLSTELWMEGAIRSKDLTVGCAYDRFMAEQHFFGIKDIYSYCIAEKSSIEIVPLLLLLLLLLLS